MIFVHVGIENIRDVFFWDTMYIGLDLLLY